MARVNWSVNIESAFRAVTRRRAVDSGKAGARRKKALASIQIFGEIAVVRHAFSPALPDTGPPSTAGFVFLDGLFLRGRHMPANLPVGRDLTIRRKIENGRYYCAFAVRKPMIEAGHHVELNPRGPEAARRGAVYV
jgi:hypothetical protein